MLLHRIRTFIREERAALTALLVVSVVSAFGLGGVMALGDQRDFGVQSVSPGDGETAPSTVRALTVTFSGEPDREAVEERLTIEPEVGVSARWRGRVLEMVFASALAPGEYRVRIDGGAIGAAGEEMGEPFETVFSVREAGVALVVAREGGQALVEVRDGTEHELVTAARIRDYAISPDGSQIAVVIEGTAVAGEAANGGLVLVDTLTEEARVVVDDAEVDIGSVSWTADSSALLVVRRDRLPSGEQGVPRTWLTRTSGEFVALIDPEGEPSLAATWSPDAQLIAYTAPATGEAVVLNLSTREEVVLGQPRSDRLAWSPDSRMVAFESVPAADSTGGAPAQPIRIVSLDGSVDRFFGGNGETRLRPRFLDADTIIGLRRTAGANQIGTELLFESVEDGRLLRTILLAPGNDLVLGWDLDPSHERVIYAVRSGASLTVLTLDLESGDREVLGVAGDLPRWLP